MKPSPNWVKPIPELPVTPEGMQVYLDGLKNAVKEWHEFIAWGERLVAYTKRNPLVLGDSKPKPARILKSVKG